MSIAAMRYTGYSTTEVEDTHERVYRWLNYDGRLLQESRVLMSSDEVPTYTGSIPTRPVSNGLLYTFSNWSEGKPQNVDEDLWIEYTAEYTSQSAYVWEKWNVNTTTRTAWIRDAMQSQNATESYGTRGHMTYCYFTSSYGSYNTLLDEPGAYCYRDMPEIINGVPDFSKGSYYAFRAVGDSAAGEFPIYPGEESGSFNTSWFGPTTPVWVLGKASKPGCYANIGRLTWSTGGTNICGMLTTGSYTYPLWHFVMPDDSTKPWTITTYHLGTETVHTKGSQLLGEVIGETPDAYQEGYSAQDNCWYVKKVFM